VTTIVATRTQMAADRRVVHGELRYTSRKIERIGDALVGVAGDATGANKFLRWFRAGADIDSLPKFGKDEDIEVLVLSSAGLFRFDASCFPDLIDDPFYAVGAGAQAALAAMHVYADVEWAIEIASLVNNDTGDGIDILTL
jgi:ATP-dependent protease HslVU (ClpYQ) peptidase subunit